MINIMKKVILKRKLKQAGFNWIKVDKSIIHKYRYTTNRNKDASDFYIEFKLNRSFYSSKPDSINELRDIHYYGVLKIIKDNKRNLITYIQNNKKGRYGKINLETKDKITEIYNSVFGGGEV